MFKGDPLLPVLLSHWKVQLGFELYGTGSKGSICFSPLDRAEGCFFVNQYQSSYLWRQAEKNKKDLSSTNK